MSRATLLVGGSAAASLLLVLVYLAAGGASYAPTEVQDPCEPREWSDPGGLQEIAQQFSLSALDGAACELGVTREELAQGLATEDAREEFVERHDISDEELARAVRAGLLRAVDDAEEAGAISPLIGVPLRQLIRSVPLDEAVELINDADRLLEEARSFLGPAGGLLEQFIP